MAALGVFISSTHTSQEKPCKCPCQFHHLLLNAATFPQQHQDVVINGATKDTGKAAIVAVSRARGMEVAGAIDSGCVGEDAGMISNMEEPLEIPVVNDLTMVLGSIAQSKATGMVVDFTEPSTVYDNVKQVKTAVEVLVEAEQVGFLASMCFSPCHGPAIVNLQQAAAFALSSVVYVPKIELGTVAALSAFCQNANMVCLVAPTLSIGSVLAKLQSKLHSIIKMWK